jgi:hypothetical protein
MKPEDKAFHDFLDEATRIVQSWPAWKRGVLGASSRATNDFPRQPIYREEKKVAVPDYLLCDRCGDKIPRDATISISFNPHTDPAGDIDTDYVSGDYCDKCLARFFRDILHELKIREVDTIGIMFDKWHNNNLKTSKK